eukprot:2331910-Rhodomonas_salina.1
MDSANTECSFRTEVTCQDNGALSSEAVGCRTQACEVRCELGSRYAGPNASTYGYDRRNPTHLLL